ncbi:MAG: citrate lyase holo-[Clostridia bacterium]|nr:citrate lyase holo-[acyl-carrier protein] synthase [Clostridia bacterium]
MEQVVTLPMMLEAREVRANRQRMLLERHKCPLVSFTMNIAGPVKNGPLIRRGFLLGREALLSRLRLAGAELLETVETDTATGCEGIYAVRFPADALKRMTCEIEESTKPGRLFDMDVIATDGGKLDRPQPRTCLICGNLARDCARNRTHTVEQLQSATQAILLDAVQTADAAHGAELAVRALLFEVAVTPKPGLVDRINNGSHRDMDFYSFLSSAAALWPYFEDCVRTGMKTAKEAAKTTLTTLRPLGLQAECRCAEQMAMSIPTRERSFHLEFSAGRWDASSGNSG